MKNIKEYLINESSFSNWNDIEDALENFIVDANLEKFSDDEDNDIDEILSSFEEWLIEIYNINKSSVKRSLKKFDSQIRYWLFDNGIVEDN